MLLFRLNFPLHDVEQTISFIIGKNPFDLSFSWFSIFGHDLFASRFIQCPLSFPSHPLDLDNFVLSNFTVKLGGRRHIVIWVLKVVVGGVQIYQNDNSSCFTPNFFVMVNYKTFHLKHYIVFVKICPPTGQITFYPILQGKNGQNKPENQQNWNMAKIAPKSDKFTK